MNTEKKNPYKIRKNIPLRRYTTFRIGGPADFFLNAASVRQMRFGVYFAHEHNLPFFVIGGGSNLLVNDRGVRGLVIKNSLKGLGLEKGLIQVRSGEKLSSLVDFALKNRLTGLEFATGIPGSVGGAIYGNAGAYGKSLGALIEKACLMDRRGQIRWVDSGYFNFDYRWSALKQTGEIVIKAGIRLEPGDGIQIRKQMDEILENRRSKHPDKEWGCAGSYFKNITMCPGERKTAAGKLLEKVGAKNIKVGKAEVYPGHANFLTNPGCATAAEILELASILRKKVREEFNIELEEEVIYVDEYLKECVKYGVCCMGPVDETPEIHN